MRNFREDLAYWCAVGFGSGLIKPAPGTWGTLAGTGLFWLGLTFLPGAWIFVALVLSTLLGGYICRIGGERLGEVDHGSIVWDEIVAIGWLLWLVALFYPLTWITLGFAFVLFRIFDIIKPWPISRVDAWHTPWSVMFDDLLALFYAVIVFFMLIPYFHF
jgi:phosphatidylglycerophosphatase A